MREDPDVTVVIPARDEATALPATLASLAGLRGVEIILADGGSRDDTVRIARDAGAIVVQDQGGRAGQLAAGAAAARAPILLFLHADTRLAADALGHVRAALADAAVVGGAFPVRFESDRLTFRLLAHAINLRTRLLHLPYGDQGIFVRTTVFRAMGGFRRLEIMEDLDFARRLRRHGRVVTLPCPVVTSDRRWRANGVIRTTLVNWAATLLFALRVRPGWIRRFYDSQLASGRS